MSVTTTADEKLREARENLEVAYKNILSVLNPDTWGNSEYSSEYLEKLHNIASELFKIKKEL